MPIQSRFDEFEDENVGDKLTNLGTALGAAAGLIKGDPRGLTAMMAGRGRGSSSADIKMKRAKLLFDAYVGGAAAIQKAPFNARAGLVAQFNRVGQIVDSKFDLSPLVGSTAVPGSLDKLIKALSFNEHVQTAMIEEVAEAGATDAQSTVKWVLENFERGRSVSHSIETSNLPALGDAIKKADPEAWNDWINMSEDNKTTPDVFAFLNRRPKIKEVMGEATMDALLNNDAARAAAGMPSLEREKKILTERQDPPEVRLAKFVEAFGKPTTEEGVEPAKNAVRAKAKALGLPTTIGEQYAALVAGPVGRGIAAGQERVGTATGIVKGLTKEGEPSPLDAGQLISILSGVSPGDLGQVTRATTEMAEKTSLDLLRFVDLADDADKFVRDLPDAAVGLFQPLLRAAAIGEQIPKFNTFFTSIAGKLSGDPKAIEKVRETHAVFTELAAAVASAARGTDNKVTDFSVKNAIAALGVDSLGATRESLLAAISRMRRRVEKDYNRVSTVARTKKLPALPSRENGGDERAGIEDLARRLGLRVEINKDGTVTVK